MNNLTGLIPILYEALQVISRELVGIIPAASRSMTAENAALGQPVRIPKTPETGNRDITPGTPPVGAGTDFGYVDLVLTKDRIAEPIVWTGDQQISVGGQLNQMMVNQYTQALRSLVNEVEQDICLEAVLGALKAGNVFGTAGTTPFLNDITELAAIRKIQDDLGTPKANRQLIINTATGMNLRNQKLLLSVAHSGENDMLRRGVLNNLYDYAIRETAGFQQMNPGTQQSLELSADAAKGSNSIAVTALTGTLNIGAIIMIAGKYHTVTAPAIAGATIVNISPALSEDVDSGTTAMVLSSYLPNVAFSRDFIYAATRNPALPQRANNAGGQLLDIYQLTDPVSGLSFQVTLWENYRQIRIEIGLTWGSKAVNDRNGVLLLG